MMGQIVRYNDFEQTHVKTVFNVKSADAVIGVTQKFDATAVFRLLAKSWLPQKLPPIATVSVLLK